MFEVDEVRTIVERALVAAIANPNDADRKRDLHARRSRGFVSALAAELRVHYGRESDVRVFDKHYAGNESDFGVNELLYDVTVCRVGSTPAARSTRLLSHVSAPLWAIESELARNSRDALHDFNKLVLSGAPNKLFVGPRSAHEQGYLEVLRSAARCCTGEVFLALVPHPDVWDSAERLAYCERAKSGREHAGALG